MPKQSKADKQVVKDEADATKREEARKAKQEPGYYVHLGGGQHKFVPTGKPKE